MSTLAELVRRITIGVDTHCDFHVATVIDERGGVLGTERFATNTAGYRSLVTWARSFGDIAAVGIEGTGSYGAGLTRFLASEGISCSEVPRQNQQHRRRYGKSDEADAYGAAKAAQSDEPIPVPRGRDREIEGLRTNRVAHRSALKARTQAINQLRALIVTAPDELRQRLRNLSIDRIVATAAAFRPSADLDELNTTKHAMRSIARRIKYFDEEIEQLEALRHQLVVAAAPKELREQHGVGDACAADLVIAFGSNPDRISTDSAFAALCGVSPVDASSGKRLRHRLNRGGDRQANSALWTITLCRLSNHEPTRAYMSKKLTQGRTKREAIRSLKRYISRQIWKIFRNHQIQLANP